MSAVALKTVNTVFTLEISPGKYLGTYLSRYFTYQVHDRSDIHP